MTRLEGGSALRFPCPSSENEGPHPGLDITRLRRGSAVDILQSKCVRDMVRHGGWAREASASAYAAIDDIDTEKFPDACISMIDLSDDE